MKEPISSYEDYCRVWAEVYKKHARHTVRDMFSCYVRQGILRALEMGPSYPRPHKEVTTDEDLVGLYIVRALVAQGMDERSIEEYTVTMQYIVDTAENNDVCVTDAMRDGLCALGVSTYDSSSVRIEHHANRLRYLWAKHGGFELYDVDS